MVDTEVYGSRILIFFFLVKSVRAKSLKYRLKSLMLSTICYCMHILCTYIIPNYQENTFIDCLTSFMFAVRCHKSKGNVIRIDRDSSFNISLHVISMNKERSQCAWIENSMPVILCVLRFSIERFTSMFQGYFTRITATLLPQCPWRHPDE